MLDTKIITTAPLGKNPEYTAFHNWLWALENFAFRHPAHHEVPGQLPFSNISNAPACIISYSMIIEQMFADKLNIELAVLDDNPRVLTSYADGEIETFKGKVLFKYRKPYERVNGEKSFGDDGVPMVPFIGNFMFMPCDAAAAEKLRRCVSRSETTCGLIVGYFAHVGKFADFGGGTAKNMSGRYIPYELCDADVDEEMAKLLIEDEDIKRYFALFESFDDFVEKNFLQDFFIEGANGQSTLVCFFGEGYTKEAYNEFATVSREIINNRGQRVVDFLRAVDKKMVGSIW